MSFLNKFFERNANIDKQLENDVAGSAQIFVRESTESLEFKGKFDYSEKSLTYLEKFMETNIDKNDSTKKDIGALKKHYLLIGSYFSEVVRKNLGGHYMMPKTGLFKDEIILANIGNIKEAATFNKTLKRLKDGSVDSLAGMYYALKQAKEGKLG